MKKSILLITLLALTFAATAQTKTTVKAKTDTVTKYTYFVKLPVADIQQYFQILGDYRGLVIYDTNKTPQQKVDMQVAVDAYLKRLQSVVKVDSVKVK